MSISTFGKSNIFNVVSVFRGQQCNGNTLIQGLAQSKHSILLMSDDFLTLLGNINTYKMLSHEFHDFILAPVLWSSMIINPTLQISKIETEEISPILDHSSSSRRSRVIGWCWAGVVVGWTHRVTTKEEGSSKWLPKAAPSHLGLEQVVVPWSKLESVPWSENLDL